MRTMNKTMIKTGVRLLVIAVVITGTAFTSGCVPKCPITEPNAETFRREVPSPDLRAGFDAGRLMPGMPYFVVQELFGECGNRRHIPVSSVGSQPALDIEGWGRRSHDPDIKVYMDKYKTDRGELTVWYRFQDFYRMEVKAGDSIYVYWEDSIKVTLVDCLVDRDNVTVQNSLTGIPEFSECFGVVRHLDNPKYVTTYYYELVLEDSLTLSLDAAERDTYPIQKIEVNGEPADFFQWR